MQKRLLLLVCLLFTFVGLSHTQAQRKSAQTSSDAAWVEGRVRIKLQREVALRLEKAQLPTENGALKAAGKANYVHTGITQLDRVAQKVKAVSMKRVFPEAGKDEARHKQFGLDLWYDVTYNESSMTPAQVRNLYTQTAGVVYAQRIPIYQLVGGESFRTVSPTVAAAASGESRTSTMPFNDPLLSSQWHYNNTGTLQDSKVGADINLFKAWKEGVYGSKDVVVAIIDGGFQTDHPDLKDNVWINEAELNGQPGVDDDGDGFVDDIYGFNFVTNSSDISAHSHGTHVAGTVGATNGNGVGVCGVAGGSDGTGGVKMMVCQVYDSRSSTGDADFGAAIVYAADRGASIAQCSWGSAYADEEDKSISEAVKYFTQYGGGDKMNGGLCIFASGNTNDEGNYYPQCLDEVVAVAASTSTGEPAYYSTIGSWVDVTAPGGLEDYGEKYGVLSTLPNSTYGYSEGTSMACPHVSGVAALILSKYGNKNFSNATLRTLLTSSVSELDFSNYSSYQGKVGDGVIDAYKALQGNEGSTPEAVGDYTLTASHDNVLVEWTIPESDEKSIDHHIIYYSTEAFSATDNLNRLPSVTVDTKFKDCGDAMSYELTGLKANTTYYFAIVAYNRWGTASAVSAVKSATTNAGPVASVSKTSLNLTLDASKNTVTTGTFNISNKGEGILKYELTSATKKVSYSTSSRNMKPTPGRIVPFSGKMSTSSVANHEIVTADYQAEDWPQSMTWASTLLAYLGEEDETLPNALAQYFVVNKDSFPEGFNLTALNFRGAYGENPEIEIYDGTRSISTASLLQKVQYEGDFAYNSDIALSEQIFFEPGASFWVVAKFPAGQTNPLGAAKTKYSNISQYSFYSSDNGATWTQLSEVVKGGNYESYADQMTWALTCKSKNPDWSAVLNPQPASGEVRQGETQTVTVQNDGQKLVNGTYNFNLRVKTNEAEASDNQVAVNMTVKGNKPVITSKKLVDFGSLIVGQSKTIAIELVNSGYGSFSGRYGMGLYSYNGGVTTSSDQFDVSAGAPAVSARSTSTMNLTYKPTKAGDVTSTITLTDKDGNTYSFIARGVASEAAKLSVTPESYDFGDLEVGGASKTATFTIKNEGKYPLQYVFPKFSSENIEGSTGKAHKFGYTYVSNIGGSTDIEYEAAPELTDEVDITSQFNDNNWQSSAISLGFQFPFYGVNYDKVHISARGGIAMNTITGTIGCMVAEPACMKGLGYISGWASSGDLSCDAYSKVSYGHKDGKFVVKFKDVISNGAEAQFKLSFHMVLDPEGNASIYYDDYDRFQSTYEGGLIYVGVVDENLTDPFTITDNDEYWETTSTNPIYANISTGTAIKILAPTPSMVESVSSVDGYIGIGESKNITVTVAAGENQNAGPLTNNLVMLTNDPSNGSKNIVLKANITGAGLTPVASTDSTQVDFGRVFRGSKQQRTVALTNTGKDVLTVSSISFSGNLFSLADADLKNGFSVAAGNGKDIIVALNTETSQQVAATMTISYADGSKSDIALKANIVGTPVFAVDPESIDVTTPYGENVAQDLVFTNNGDEDLTVSITPDSWFRVSDASASDESTSVDYTYQSTVDGFDVTNEWVDITSDYTEHMPYSYYYEQTDYKEVTLPFEFAFYGKKYKKMYIYNTGFVRFTEPTVDYKEFPEPPATLPSTDTFYDNIICPYWGNHSMNTASSDGVYYKAEDDRVVVSFYNYGNSMMSGMNYQVILNNDGSFRFQYNLDNDGMYMMAFGLCGIMDDTFKRGVCPGDRYIAPGSSMLWKPVMTYTIAPGKTKTVGVELLADQLADDYSYEMQLTTNDPQRSQVSIPVRLNITGEAVPVFPTEIVIEEAVSPELEDGLGETYYKDFTVKNNGDRAFTITNIDSPLFDMNMETYMQDAMLLVDASALGESDDSGVDPGPLSLTSASTTSWTAYQSGYTSPITVGKDSIRFRVAVYNTTNVYKKSDKLTFTVEGLDATTKQVPMTINITEAPAMTFDKDSIVIVNADDTYKQTETLTIGNEGKYTLKYAFHLNPSGTDEVLDTEDVNIGGDVSPLSYAPKADLTKGLEQMALSFGNAGKLKKASSKASAYVWDLPSNFSGSNALYYPILQPASSALAYWMGALDTENEFRTATQFTAPAEGFNLTHIYFAGTVRSLQNVDIEAYVVKGTDVTATDNIVTRGKLHIDKESSTTSPVARTIEFNYPVYFSANENFYIVLKYPAGNEYSTFLVSKDGDKCANRYMCYMKTMGGWFDMEEVGDANYSMGANGWFMTAIEQEPGEPWIKLLNSETEGEIAVGQTLPVNFAVDASKTHVTNQHATLVIKSNDPKQKLVNYHIYLNRNAAPEVTAPKSTYTVQEGATATLPLTVSDPDGDAFSLSLADDEGIASIESYSPTTGVTEADGTLSVPAGTTLALNVKLAPGYETAGSHTFTVNAADEKQNASETSVAYNVEHSNRAPEFKGITELTVSKGSSSAAISFASLFSDPDGDTMTFTVSVASSRIASVYTSETGFVVYGIRTGSTTITVTATDANGASTTGTIKLTVDDGTGISGVSMADGQISVDESGNVTLAEHADHVVLRAYNVAGQQVATLTADNVSAGETLSLNLSATPAGVYHLVADVDGQTTVLKFAKK